MANCCNFKSVIVLNEDPLVNDPTVTKVSAIPNAETAKPVSLKIYTNNEIKGIEYFMLQCPSVFTQTLGELCWDTEMIHLYKHFFLRGSVLLSEYWREACAEHKDRKEGNTWSDGLFVIVMKEYKN